MSMQTIEVERRTETGKNAARRLRENGLLPCVVYGGGKEPVAITLPRRTLQDQYRAGAHANTIFLLQLSGTDQKRHVMMKDVTIDPISRHFTHVDFVRVDVKEKVRISVPLVLTHEEECEGVKTDGGMLDFITRKFHLECLPGDIPAEVEVDVSELRAGESFRLADLGLDPEKFKILDEEERVVVSVAIPKAADEESTEDEDEDVEPEVISRAAPAEEE